jgi:hypothetical protein
LDSVVADAVGPDRAARQLLPDRQPAYVQSWIYVFGVATLAALVVLASGLVLAEGRVVAPRRLDTSSTRAPVGVELFFVCMVITCGASSLWRVARSGR